MLGSKNALWLLSAALPSFWGEPGRFGHRVLLRVLPLVRKLGQMLLQLLAVSNLFLGQWRLKRFWRRRGILSQRRCRRWRQNHSSRRWWLGGLLGRDSPRLRQILSIFFLGFPLQELFLSLTLDLSPVLQGLGPPF